MTDRFPKVSIITVSYNSASTIEKTINSITAQTYPNIEYIVIDGGSTDNTVDIIKKYEKHISYWISEPDKGISDAFNKGIKASTGDFIGMINSDDWYMDNAVQTVVDAMLQQRDAGFVFGDMYYIDQSDNIVFTLIGDPNYGEKIAYTLPNIAHPTVFVRSDIYKAHGFFDLNCRVAMDYEFLLRITKNGVLGYYIPTVISNMRLGGISDYSCTDGYKEVCAISKLYGYNAFLANLRLTIKIIRTSLRKFLEKNGADSVIRIYRGIFNKALRYGR